MIRRLRARMIVASMLSLTFILTCILSTVSFIFYREITQDADRVLDMLHESGGQFPPPHVKEPPNGGISPSGTPAPPHENEAPSDKRERAPQSDAPAPPLVSLASEPRSRSPEMMFETRYFSVLIDSDGAILESNVSNIAAVDSDEVRSFVLKVLAKDKTRGFTGNYRYLRCDENENTRVYFIDCLRELAGFRTMLFLNLGISAIGLLAVLILLILLSDRIIRPIISSHEKQKRFISDAGHEIKTPLTIIDADAELLEMEIGGNEWLEDIRAQTRRLIGLTGDLLCLSRMEEPGAMQMIEFPLSDLISETAASFRSLAITQNRQLTADIQPMLTIRGNAPGISRLTGALLDNAVKYSCEGSTIRLRLHAQGRAVILTVTNAVDSISQEIIEGMFDRFYRGDPSRSSGVSGYGMGLSIAKSIVLAHKGRIHAASPDGKSLQITVTLPIA